MINCYYIIVKEEVLDLVDDVKSLLILVYYINVFFCFILLLIEIIEIKCVKLLKVWMKDIKIV